MSNVQRYQPRRGRSQGGSWGRWVVVMVVVVGIAAVSLQLFKSHPAEQAKKTSNTNDGIRLVTDNANTSVAPTNSSATNSNTNTATVAGTSASWSGFSTTQCPNAISSFGKQHRVVLTVALSADNEQATQALEALKVAKVTADFFVTGTFAEKHSDLVKKVSQAGYPVYSQSYDGTDLAKTKDVDVATAITKTEAAIVAATGVSSKPIFRPPGGSYTPQTLKLLNQAGYCAVLWTVDAYDWQSASTLDQAQTRVMDAIGNKNGGSIVALHAGYDVTPQLIAQLVPAIKATGAEIVSLATLLKQ